MLTSVALETLNGYRNFKFSGTEMTLTFSGIDRILLVIFLVCAFLTWFFWMKFSGRG